MGRWQAWWCVGVVWAVGCSSPSTEPQESDAGVDGLQATCEAAGGDFYVRPSATLCVFGERQGTSVGAEFACPEGFPNRLGDAGLLFCNASDVFLMETLIEIDARYPECVDCEGDAGDVGGDADADVGDTEEPERFASCAMPGELVWVDGVAEAEGSFVGTPPDESLSCDANATVGHVYALTLEEPGDLVVEVEADEGTFVPALSVRTVCGQRASLLPGSCVGHRARPGQNAAVLLSAEATTYYVWVATPAAETGTYRLRASFSEREGAQPLESCEGLPAVTLREGERLGLGVSARGQFEVGGTLCEHEATSRAELHVDVQADGYWTVDLLRGEGQGFAARTRQVCGSAEGEVCGDIIVGERRRNLLQAEVDAGIKTLSLGNLPNSSLPGYGLELRHSAETAGESCDRPEVLDVSTRDEAGVFEAVIASSLLSYDDNAAAPCGINGRDRVWELELEEASDVRVEALSASGDPLSVTLTAGCDAPGYCAVEGVERAGLEAGTYYVRVDGDLDDPAAFDLAVSIRPALIGGSCAAPGEPVVLSRGEPVVVSLREDDGPSGLLSCASEAARDRVVPLNLVEGGDLALSVTGEVSLEGLVVEHASSCEESGSCGAMDGGIAALEAGDQVIKLGSTDAAQEGDVEVELKLLNPGERCFGAQPLALNQDHALTLQGYQADAAPSCAGALQADRAFSFELDATSTVILALTPADVEDGAALWVERDVCGQSQELSCDAADAGQPATLVLGALQPGIYRVWVGGDPGDYTLNISTN
ncbi:hypothetical protein FRC98_07395 [Lujinxingia vulgaris]|uniref:Uncharacterized protein n=1 Tax=Lujinxingia vulgaris TaxID=2600176 RepID=A0A5C6XAL5_9DELT|nr:hypothetical protein [Lujinxingia vulgaris]TXD37510.1 hypothetical protein FRC98_07395 [Lujinxingia vulgaris]